MLWLTLPDVCALYMHTHLHPGVWTCLEENQTGGPGRFTTSRAGFLLCCVLDAGCISRPALGARHYLGLFPCDVHCRRGALVYLQPF